MTTNSTFRAHADDSDAQGAERAPAVRAAIGRRVRAVYLFVLFALLLLGGVTFTLSTFHKVFYPFGWDDDEGAVWWESAHVTDLRELYHPIQQYPYFVVPYPPVFHAVTWLAAQGTSDFLIAGRLVCVFSALGISLLLGLMVWHASPKEIPVHIRGSGAVLASLLCFRLDSLSIYIPEMGVDLLALFLTFLGVYLFLRFWQGSVMLYAAFACLAVAMFTKQTMVAGPMACLVAAGLMNPRRALRYFLFCVTLGGAGLGLLAWATGGEALRHLFMYNARQPFSLAHWIVGLQANVMDMIPIAAVAFLAGLPFIRDAVADRQEGFVFRLQADLRKRVDRLALFVLGMEVVVALIVTLTYGKSGSGVHYFLEWNFACCALAGLLFVRVLRNWRANSSYTLGGTAVCMLVLLAAVTGVPESLRRINDVCRLTASEREVADARYASDAAVLKVVEETPGPVLCENMLLVMKAGKEIPIEPGIQTFLAKAGIWDQSGFVNMIATQRFGVIVMRTLDNGFWTDEILRAIAENYAPAEQIGNESIENAHYTVYRPRKR